MNHNVIMLTVCTGLLTDQFSTAMVISLHAGVVPIGHRFSFFWSWKCHGKSVWEKRGHPV